MQLELIGPHPFAHDEQGRQITRIGTVFPSYGVLWTQAPGVHALQRLWFIEHVNQQRAAKALPPLSLEEEEKLSANSLDLVFEADLILIRPDPEHMDLAFAAETLKPIPKDHILARKASDLEALRQMAATNHLELVKLVLNSYGGKAT